MVLPMRNRTRGANMRKSDRAGKQIVFRLVPKDNRKTLRNLLLGWLGKPVKVRIRK
jgi:hypothetical protein